MEVSLKGKLVIVTGALSGIGLAVTLRYLESGAEGVIAVDQRADSPVELEGAQVQYPGKLIVVRGDVSQESTAIEYANAAIENFGKIDVLVSNAACSVVKPIHEHTPEQWNSVMDVNVKGLYWGARAVIPHMMKANNGLILVTGSISGEAGIPNQGAYAASKGALHQMVRQMAIEYAPYGIRANAIACGTVDTPLVHQSAQDSGDTDKFWAMLKNAHPIGRIATSQEVADFFTYMASDRASFFTGSTIMMDGGYTAQ